MPAQNTATSASFKITVGGKEVDSNRLVSWVVEQDLGQPSMCSVTLRNEDHGFSDKHKAGDDIIVKAGDQNEDVFFGEIVCLEPTYTTRAENTIVLRAFDRLHKLTRGKKSKTFTGWSDEEIVKSIVGPYQLAPKCGSKANEMKYDHVYQHNQTDLEFLRIRAARLGYDVWVEGKALHFDRPDSTEDSGITLSYQDPNAAQSSPSGGEAPIVLKRFAPKFSTARVLEQVEVRGWDPIKKEAIIGVGKPEALASGLGSKKAHQALATQDPSQASFEVDHPISSKEEAEQIALAKLKEANMSLMTGEGECRGTPGIKPGVAVTITVNPGKQDRFNGRYLVMGATHRYMSSKMPERNGYITSFRVCRDGEGE